METNNLSFNKTGKELPFSVPENYFEQFASQMDAQIGYTSSSRKIFRPWMYMAAAILIGVVVITPFFRGNNQPATAHTSDSSYESYVLSQVDESVLLDCYVDDTAAK